MLRSTSGYVPQAANNPDLFSQVQNLFSQETSKGTLYDLSAVDIDGVVIPLNFAGNVTVIINVATK